MAKRPDIAAALDVVVVMYRSADVIGACIASLLAQRPFIGRIVLVDNASPDTSTDVARKVAEDHGFDCAERGPGETDPSIASNGIEIIRSSENLGFAGGVNLGLSHLMEHQSSKFFWVLNPDCELTPGCAETLLSKAQTLDNGGGFSLLGTRILYHGKKPIIQSDGGIYCTWTGRCRNLNQGRDVANADETETPSCDFISGASMIASRRFIEQSGMMPDDYFLYYEEVDWAMQRYGLPLIRCLDAVVQHHGGTAIGSGAHNRDASPLSNYFNFRNRMRFMRRYHPMRLPISYGFSVLKIIQTLCRNDWAGAVAAFRGLHGFRPPRQVSESFEAHEHARAFSNRRMIKTGPATQQSLRAPA